MPSLGHEKLKLMKNFVSSAISSSQLTVTSLYMVINLHTACMRELTAPQYILCRLYKSLGDFDTLCGIFSGEIGTKAVTRDALEAEERRDYQRALQLYKEVHCAIDLCIFA